MATGSINLLLPILPETRDVELFKELVRVYNAINILASGLGSATNDGTIVEDIDAMSAVPSTLFELYKAYYEYTLPYLTILGDLTVEGKIEVTTSIECNTTLEVGTDATIHGELEVEGAFGCNNKAPQASVSVLGTATAPSGGAGIAAGGWSSSGDRDTAIAAINTNAAAIDRINAMLVANGIGA